MQKNSLVLPLKEWFQIHKRDLPWRQSLTPYAVWVSEIMLQQTQVKTVIPYFQRWMSAFPTIEDLAKAPLETVIKLWEGLGYYSRARNLHKGAKEILLSYGGTMPSSPAELLKISGIGPYTLGAILSFAFRKRATLIDGNVKRVISRFLGLKLDFTKLVNHKKLEEILLQILPQEEPWVFNEALMELGALICSPATPNCSQCPLQKSCYAYKHNQQKELPLKVSRKKIIKLHRAVLILEYEKNILIQKQTGDLMQDLYELPYFEFTYEKDKDLLSDKRLSRWAVQSKELTPLPIFKHGFTHHQVTLWPYYIQLKQKISLEDFTWFSLGELQKKPFSSGHRKVMTYFTEAFA